MRGLYCVGDGSVGIVLRWNKDSVGFNTVAFCYKALLGAVVCGYYVRAC